MVRVTDSELNEEVVLASKPPKGDKAAKIEASGAVKQDSTPNNKLNYNQRRNKRGFSADRGKISHPLIFKK